MYYLGIADESGFCAMDWVKEAEKARKARKAVPRIIWICRRFQGWREISCRLRHLSRNFTSTLLRIYRLRIDTEGIFNSIKYLGTVLPCIIQGPSRAHSQEGLRSKTVRWLKRRRLTECRVSHEQVYRGYASWW